MVYSVKYLDKQHILYGDKNCVYKHTAHIAHVKGKRTLCGKLISQTNWVQNANRQEPGCEKCIERYYEIKTTEQMGLPEKIKKL